MSIIRFFARQGTFVNLLTFFLAGLGIFAFRDMRREAFPAVSFEIYVVGTSFPGAGPAEVEKLVTIPIEKSLERISGIKRVQSISIENRSTVVVFADPDADARQVFDDVQREVGKVKDLPSDADDPSVDDMSQFWPVLSVSVGSAKATPVQLREMAKRLQEQLEDVKGVAQVDASGLQDREIWVELDETKLRSNALSVQHVVDALSRQNIQLPAGRLEFGGEEVLVRTSGEFEKASEIDRIVVRSNDEGSKVRVRDIATVLPELQESRLRNRVMGSPAISLQVKKRRTGDVIDIADRVKVMMADWRRDHPTFTFAIADDMSFYVKRRLDVATNNAIVGFSLIFGLLFLTTSPVLAIFTALGSVLALLVGVFFSWWAGLTLNLMSLFGFVIVAGIMDDDSIVISEAIREKLEEGLPPFEAAVRGAESVALPVLAGVLTAMASFLPLLLMPGIMGKFLSQVPLVVVLCLLASLIEAYLIMPNHMAEYRYLDDKPLLMRWRAWQERRVFPVLDAIQRSYLRVLSQAVAAPWRTIALATSLLVLIFGGGIASGLLRFKLFPVGVDEFMVNVELKVGASLDATQAAIAKVENAVLKLPAYELDTVASTVGIAGDPDTPTRGSHVGTVRVLLLPREPSWLKEKLAPYIKTLQHGRLRDGDVIADDIRAAVQKMTGIEKIEVKRRRSGPPVGKPVNIILTGEDRNQLAATSAAVQGLVKKVSGVQDVSDDLIAGKRELVVKVDERRAAAAGLSVQQVAFALRGAIDGLEATKIRKGSEEIVVRVRYARSIRNDPKALQRITVTTPRGYRVPLSSLASIEPGVGTLQLLRYEGQPSVTVSGDVDLKLSTPLAANQAIAEGMKELMKGYPEVNWKLAGENEDTQESIQSMLKLFLLALAVIFVILATQFGSLLQPLIIMAAIPFGLLGVAVVLMTHGQPMSMLGMMGAIGMTGVVVNNAMLLIEFCNEAVRAGMKPLQAVMEAGRRRLRPVLLTSATTVVGLLPLAYGLGGREEFMAPMALVMGWGITLSGFLGVVLVPCLWLMLLPFINRSPWNALTLAPGMAWQHLPWSERLSRRVLPASFYGWLRSRYQAELKIGLVRVVGAPEAAAPSTQRKRR